MTVGGAGPPASTPRRLLPTRSSSPCSSRSPLHPPIQTPVRVLSRRDQSLSERCPNRSQESVHPHRWSGRQEAPRAARQSRLAPVSSRPPINRTLGFPQSGWKRAPISDRVPCRVRGDGLLDQPSCRRQLAGWPAAFAAAARHDHEARSLSGTTPRRVIAASGTTPSLSCKRRPRSPRGPLLGRGCVVLAVIAHTASAASLQPSRRLPVLRLYAESLPYGRVLAELQTFPTLRHRSFPWCHRLYAGEPRGCRCPISSPQTLAFALF